MLISMLDESGRLIGAAVSGQRDFVKSLNGEAGSAFDRVRRPTVKAIRTAKDPDDLDGLDDDDKIAAAAEDGRRAGIEADVAAGRGGPMRKSMTDLIEEFAMLAGSQRSEPLLKSFRRVPAVPRLGPVVTAASLAGRGVVLNY